MENIQESGSRAIVIAHSVNPAGVELVTWQLKYQRFFHAELMTHRVLSRNASSSRAIPVKTMLKQVWNDPAGPIHWGANQSGMQANKELTGVRLWLAKKLFYTAGKVMCMFAYGMTKIGLHKQVVNRILEPWQYIHVIVSTTETDNLFELRDHKDAQPEFQDLAKKMKASLEVSKPRKLITGDWHLPYIRDGERYMSVDILKRVSAARTARVSYLTHDGKIPSILDDLKLYERLVGSAPIHASPTEHPAMALGGKQGKTMHKNFRGWYQHRHEVEDRIASAKEWK